MAGSAFPESPLEFGVFDWIDNQDEFIQASDLVMGRAGHGTIMKSLLYGKPMVLVPIPDHTEQYGNARRAASLHVAEMIDQDRLNQSTVAAEVSKVLGNSEYAQSAERISREAASMHAITTACDLVQALAANSP